MKIFKTGALVLLKKPICDNDKKVYRITDLEVILYDDNSIRVLAGLTPDADYQPNNDGYYTGKNCRIENIKKLKHYNNL